MATRIASGPCRLRLGSKNLNPTRQNQIRTLYLIEHHSQNLLKRFGGPVPKSFSSTQLQSINKGMFSFKRPHAFFKEETLTSPRHSVVVTSMSQAKDLAAELLPEETYKKGEYQPRRTVYLQEKLDIKQHWHLTMTIDRKACRPVVKIREVGMDTQSRTPADRGAFKNDYLFNVTDSEKKFRVSIRKMADDLGLATKARQKFQESLGALYRVFTEAQAISLEVDLLQELDGGILCANSRFLFDDDAPKRSRKIYQKSWEPLLEDENELYAKAFGLVYVRMPGDIGTVVNGAGLAMATNDAIRFHNGRSANFLDAGGQATKETMMTAFKIVMDDSRVKTIFVNIYGGITRCDMIAESIIAAVNALDRQSVPMVVRLQGTNSEQGLKLLEDANLGIHVEADFDKATKKAVELAESIPVAPNADVPKAITRKTLHEDGKRHKIEVRKKMKRVLKNKEKAKAKAKELTTDASDETKS